METLGYTPEDQAAIDGVRRLEINVRFLIAAFAILIFDHLITFGEEVERIWSEKFSLATILFFINRYANPCVFLITIFGYTCAHFVAFEGSAAAAMVSICELIMILRVYALYNRNKWLLGGLLSLWVGQIVAAAFGLASGFAAQLPPGMDYCVLTGKSKVFAALWIGPLITDTILFSLTLYRSKQYLQEAGGLNSYSFGVQRTLWVLVRDGTMYFLAIVLVNLFSILVFFLGAEDIKSLGGPFWQIITSVMVSRLVLNLRASANNSDAIVRGPSGTFDSNFGLGSRGLGNPGEEARISFRNLGTPRHAFEDELPTTFTMSINASQRSEWLTR